MTLDRDLNLVYFQTDSNNFATISDTCAHFTQDLYWTKGHVYQLVLGF